MEEKLAVHICRYLLKNGIIQQDLFEVYCYGTELLLSFLISTSVILGIGIISRRIVQTVVFLILFIFLRRFTGGYHANTYLACKAFTVGTYIAVITLSEFTNVSAPHYLLTFLTGICVILKWGPIENPNKPLTDEEKKKCRIIAFVLYVFFALIGYFTPFLSGSLSNVICYTLMFVIALMIQSLLCKGGNEQ